MPFDNSTNSRGFPCNLRCNDEATFNSSKGSLNDIAAANRTTASGPLITAIGTSSPFSWANSIICLKCLGTKRATV